MEKGGLESVELHIPVRIVRRNHQEQDPGDETEEIAQSAGRIISQSRTPRGRCRYGRRNRARVYSCAALLAESTIDLRTTARTKCHFVPSVDSLYLKSRGLASLLDF